MLLIAILLLLVIGLQFGTLHRLRDISRRLEKVESEIHTVFLSSTSKQSAIAHRTTSRQAPQVDAGLSRPRPERRDDPIISSDEVLLKARMGRVATHREGGDIDPVTGLTSDDRLQQDRGYPTAQVGEDQGHSSDPGASENR